MAKPKNVRQPFFAMEVHYDRVRIPRHYNDEDDLLLLLLFSRHCVFSRLAVRTTMEVYGRNDKTLDLYLAGIRKVQSAYLRGNFLEVATPVECFDHPMQVPLIPTEAYRGSTNRSA